MKKIKIIVLSIVALAALSSSANAESTLQPDDFVGFSFWLISLASLAATAFFFLERSSVATAWKAPLSVAGIITGITFVHSMYLSKLWILNGSVPIIYKYIDWFITIPLLAIQFYLILSAVRKISPINFWKFFVSALLMVCGSYAGQAGYILPFLGFLIWMSGWIYILYELFSGEAGLIVSRSSNDDFVKAFETMRIIITVGWMIYPLGYVFGYLTGGIDSNSLNVIYNFSDFVNKIAFGLVIWTAAKQS